MIEYGTGKPFSGRRIHDVARNDDDVGILMHQIVLVGLSKDNNASPSPTPRFRDFQDNSSSN